MEKIECTGDCKPCFAVQVASFVNRGCIKRNVKNGKKWKDYSRDPEIAGRDWAKRRRAENWFV